MKTRVSQTALRNAGSANARRKLAKPTKSTDDEPVSCMSVNAM